VSSNDAVNRATIFATVDFITDTSFFKF